MSKYATTLALIHLERSSSVPLYLQLYKQIRHAILEKHLSAGIRLPSTRGLAANLKVSRNTVASAFEQLFSEGYIEGKVGAGTYVANIVEAKNANITPPPKTLSSKHRLIPPEKLSQQGQRLLGMKDKIFRYRLEEINAFRPGMPALDKFPIDLWSKLSAQQWRYAQSDLLSYGDPYGYRPLRECIAKYLRLSRAMQCSTDQVIIVSGSQQALDITARVLLDPGDAVWMEDPGYTGARNVFSGIGADLVPVPVDEEGLNVAEGVFRCPSAKLAYVTPSHQFPLGYTMSLSRRTSLLQWAEQNDGWVLEDDYDSEYRYQGQPLSALHGLDKKERVIYMGTFSKVLFPSLRLGYLVVPPKLVEAFGAARAMCDRHSPLLEQAVLSEFIANGHFDRHLRKMQSLYAERQSAFVSAIQEKLGHYLDVRFCETGMHLVGWLPQGVDDRKISKALLQNGITAPALSAYCIDSFSQGGLVLGYAATDIETTKRIIEQMASIVHAVINGSSYRSAIETARFKPIDILTSAS